MSLRIENGSRIVSQQFSSVFFKSSNNTGIALVLIIQAQKTQDPAATLLFPFTIFNITNH